MTLLLTLREYQLAQLFAHGVSYAEAARRMRLSKSTVANAATRIYEKLMIGGRKELSPFLFGKKDEIS